MVSTGSGIFIMDKIEIKTEIDRLNKEIQVLKGDGMKPDNFNKNFKKHFKQSGLTQVEIAKKIGTSQGAISKILRGKEYPRIGLIINIIKAFDTTFERFCSDQD